MPRRSLEKAEVAEISNLHRVSASTAPAAPVRPVGKRRLVSRAQPAENGQALDAVNRSEWGFPAGSLLTKKKRERLLLVSFRMPEALKEKLEAAAKLHEVNQTDLINEGIALNLQRYL